MKLSFAILFAVSVLGCGTPGTPGTSERGMRRSDVFGQEILSEREAQLIYSRAHEAILWASPALAILAQIDAGRRDLGAGNCDIIYTNGSFYQGPN